MRHYGPLARETEANVGHSPAIEPRTAAPENCHRGHQVQDLTPTIP